MRKRNLILLDIDGTIVDERHRTNFDISQGIQDSRALGFSVGFNSNRALEDMTSLYKRLDLNGPLIIENGIYCKKALDSPNVTLFKDAKVLQRYLAGLLKNFVGDSNVNDIGVYVLDTTKYIGNLKHKVPGDQTNILLNKYRKYTGSVHIYKNGKPDTRLALQLYDYLGSNIDDNLLVTKPNNAANITIQPRGSSKAMGIKYLRETFPNEHEHVFMIGDSTSDAETIPFVDGFYAVGNSNREVKRKAAFVSEEPYTKGVGEILQFIVRSF